MDQVKELDEVATWLSEEGLAPDSSKEAQLCLLWRAFQHTRSRLSSVTKDLEMHRSQHVAEMDQVRKSLEQIRIFTEHKDVLAQEIQDENDQLREQLRHLISLQDAQISEVAKMLYQQGLTELIHSSPSEQVAYLLVERASLLDTAEDPDKLMGDRNPERYVEMEAQAMATSACQSTHKRAPRHLQSTWKRLFGLHKTPPSKNAKILAEARPLAAQASGLEKECSRLERDLEEGSRRLAMAHSEIRRLTDELESSHLTRRAYEPELQSAQLEVEQLRHEVEKLKKYEMVELRKTKELNDRLDLEIRALRNRVRTLDAEKSSLQQTVASLQVEVERMETALQAQQQVLTLQVESDQARERAKVKTAELTQNNKICIDLQEKLTSLTEDLVEKKELVERLQREVKRLESALEEQQHLRTVLVQENHAQSRDTEVMESNQTCLYLHNKLTADKSCILEKQSEFVDNYHSNLNNIIAKICTKENNLKDKRSSKGKNAESQTDENIRSRLENSTITENKELHTQLSKECTRPQECSGCQQAMKTLLLSQDECETLKKEICDTLKCLDIERSKNHNMKEKHKEKLCQAKQKIERETTQRDERIKNLERELSLCSHSLTKEKELVVCITFENERLLSERRKLLQQLNEEEHHKTQSNLTASLSKCRVDFLETENRKLGNKLCHMSHQIATLERSLQNMKSLHFAEDLQKKSNPQQILTSLTVHTSNVMSEIQGLLDTTQSSPTKQTDVTASSLTCTSGALYGYLNLTSSMQSLPDHSASQSSLRDSESLPS